MHTKNLSFRSIVVACALCAAAGSAFAQSDSVKKSGDPARWTTKQSTSVTLNKEINAAYAEQKADCNRLAKAERAGCLADARKTYQSDMANKKELAQNAPAGGVSERVVSTVDSGGAGSMGSSQAGAATSSGMEAGAAATGGTGSTGATGSSEGDTGNRANSSEPQPLQPTPVSPPPRSIDTPTQR